MAAVEADCPYLGRMRTPSNKLIVPALILGTAMVIAPTAVQAAIAGTTTVSGYGSVSCPYGYRVSGGGFSISANYYSSYSSDEYSVLSSRPSGTTGWTATGSKVHGYYSSSSGWRYSNGYYTPNVYAVCVK